MADSTKLNYCTGYAEKWDHNLWQILTDFQFFTGRLTNPPHLKYVATLLCNLSLIACFLTLTFHKVAWQHMQGMVGFLNNHFTTNLLWNLTTKIENRLRFDRLMAMSLWLYFFGSPCICRSVIKKPVSDGSLVYRIAQLSALFAVVDYDNCKPIFYTDMKTASCLVPF